MSECLKNIQETEHKSKLLGHLGGSVVERLLSAQVTILGSWDQVPHQTLPGEPPSPMPMSLPLSLCLS